MNEIYVGYFVTAVVAGIVIWQVVDELRWQRRDKRLRHRERHVLVGRDFVVDLDDISLAQRVAKTIPQSSMVEVSESGVWINSPDVEVVAEIISNDPAFYARGAA